MTWSPDHALGLELELAELVRRLDEARHWADTAEIARLMAEIERVQDLLADAAAAGGPDRIPPDADKALRFHGARRAAA